MAQRLGEVHDQALPHFVGVSPWDWRPVRRRLAERLVGALAPTVWAADDTGFPKTASGRWGAAPGLRHAIAHSFLTLERLGRPKPAASA